MPLWSHSTHQFCSPSLATLIQACPLWQKQLLPECVISVYWYILAKGGTHTTSPTTLCPRKKKSHGVRSRDLGVHFVKGKSACLAWPIQQFGRCSLRCVHKAPEKWRGAPLLLKETFTVLIQTLRYTLLFFLIVTPKYTFQKVFTSFVKTLYISQFY